MEFIDVQPLATDYIKVTIPIDIAQRNIERAICLRANRSAGGAKVATAIKGALER